MRNVKETSWKIMLGYWFLFLALAALINLVLFPGPWFDPLARLTGGLLNATLQGSLLQLFFFSLVIFGLAKLRPRDVGLHLKKLPQALLLTAGVWAAVQGIAVLFGLATGGLRFDPLWSERGLTVVLGALIGQLFGNALFEEVLFRGFLMTQFFIKSRAATTNRRVAAAFLGSLGLFILSHIPNRIFQGYTLSDMPFDILQLAILGGLFAALYWLSGNLFLAVGLHALVNAPTMITALPFPPSLIVIVLMAVLVVVLRKRAAPLRNALQAPFNAS